MLLNFKKIITMTSFSILRAFSSWEPLINSPFLQLLVTHTLVSTECPTSLKSRNFTCHGKLLELCWNFKISLKNTKFKNSILGCVLDNFEDGCQLEQYFYFIDNISYLTMRFVQFLFVILIWNINVYLLLKELNWNLCTKFMVQKICTIS